MKKSKRSDSTIFEIQRKFVLHCGDLAYTCPQSGHGSCLDVVSCESLIGVKTLLHPMCVLSSQSSLQGVFLSVCGEQLL